MIKFSKAIILYYGEALKSVYFTEIFYSVDHSTAHKRKSSRCRSFFFALNSLLSL